MDKSLDDLVAAAGKGKRPRDDRRQGWQGGGGGGWQGRGATKHSRSELPAAVASAAKESYFFFGDSFVRLFGLVRHPEVSVHAFKGATCRGLGKRGNENREEIMRRLATRPEANKVAMFVFGNVDVHFSYYYSLHGKAVPQRIDFEGIARDYVEFIAALPGGAALRRGVVATYPSSLVDDAKVPLCLSTYGVLTEEQTQGIDPQDCTLAARQSRVQEFNRHLERCCREKGVEYHDLFDELVDAETAVLKPEYLDISDLNIHVIWETTLLLWLRRLPFLMERTRPGFEAQLRLSLSKYIRAKKEEFAGKELSVARQHPSEARRTYGSASGGGPGAAPPARSAGPPRGGGPTEIKVRSLEELLAEKLRKAAAQTGGGGGGKPTPAAPAAQEGGRSLPASLHTEHDALFD